MVILTQTQYAVNDIIPSLATPEMAAQDRNVRAIATRAVSGDLADWPLEAVAGLLLLAGATWAGACMWWDIIALKRALLVPVYEWADNGRDHEAGLWWIAGEEHSQERWLTGEVWEV